MKKPFIAAVLGVVVLFVVVFFIQKSLISSSEVPLESTKPSENSFTFIFKYGVGAKNELNTRNGTFTKDMVSDPSITVPMMLTQDELLSISKKIKELGLLEKNPTIISPVKRIPCSSYYLKVNENSKETIKEWNDCSDDVKEEYSSFSEFIYSIINSKEEYKNLPQPKSGYL